MKEKIKLIVVVEINYELKKERSDAISKAKRCVLSTSILGSVGCNSKSAKLLTNRTN